MPSALLPRPHRRAVGVLLVVATTLALLGLAAPARAALVADYPFARGYGATDPSLPAMTPIGDVPNTFRTETVLGQPRTVLAFACNSGVEVETEGVIPPDSYSVAVLFRMQNLVGWNRIIDFNNGVGDDGLYVYHGALNLYPSVTADGTQFAEDVYAQVVLTRTADGDVTGYVNGAPAITHTDTTGATLITEGVLRFFRDNDGGGGPTTEASAGAVARIQLFDHVLSPAEVAALPDTPPPAPAPALDTDRCDETEPTPDEETPRIEGDGSEDVRRVAINVCQFLFDQPDSARTVVLARNDVFADALAGSPLAGDHSCVLYTTGGADQPLDAETRAEIDRVLPDGAPVRILGGDQAVSTLVEAELISAGYAVERFQGPSRFETAVAVSRVVRAENPGGTDVLLASGVTFPDAVTGGAFGARTGTPILLTGQEQLHAATAAAMAELGVTRTIVLGGTAAVSDAAAAAAPAAHRVAGVNRMDTAARVATELWGTVLDEVTTVVVTNIERDDGWALTLASAPLSARRDAPQLGVGAGTYPAETRAFLQAQTPPVATAYLMGNEAFISDEVAAQLGADVGQG